MAQVLGEAEAKGLGGEEIDKLEAQWMGSVEMCTFDQGISFAFLTCKFTLKLLALQL